jgi:hypothetical protein
MVPRSIGYLAEFSTPQRSPHDRLPALPHRAQHSARVWWRNKHLSGIADERSNPRGDRTYEGWYRQGRRITVDSVCFNQRTPVPGPLHPSKARHARSGLVRTSDGFVLRNIARPSARVFLDVESTKREVIPACFCAAQLLPPRTLQLTHHEVHSGSSRALVSGCADSGSCCGARA